VLRRLLKKVHLMVLVIITCLSVCVYCIVLILCFIPSLHRQEIKRALSSRAMGKSSSTQGDCVDSSAGEDATKLTLEDLKSFFA
jgi:hypothetical protein